MNYLYPINSHPWNTFPVNAGLQELLSTTMAGQGALTANYVVRRAVKLAATGQGQALMSLAVKMPLHFTAEGSGQMTGAALKMYLGALPLIVSNWDSEVSVSPHKIKLISRDKF